VIDLPPEPALAPSPGFVDLVGAGPGDPGLITRLGADCLARAEVVVYDHLVNPRLLDLAPASAERILAGKRAGKCVMRQPEINALLVDLAKAGRRVVRLKGGDPFVFARGAEEAEALAAAGIGFRVVPGVTAAVGASAYAGISVTHRDAASAVAFVTGHNGGTDAPSPIDWPALAKFPGTLVIYMGVAHLRSSCAALVAAGKPRETPSALVHSGSLAVQRTITAPLGSLADAVERAGVGAPAIVVVGDVVARREPLAWFERLPLFGQRIVVTRPAGESDRSAGVLEALGAEVLAAPTVEILPPEDYGPVDSALARLDEFHWLVFTSGNGVRHLLGRLEAIGRDLRALGRIKIAAIGPATADALLAFHLRADVVPESYRSEALAEALLGPARGGRVLLARADRGRTVLKDELERVAGVEQVAVYRNVDAAELPVHVVERIAEGSVDWITLTSPAIANRLHALLPAKARTRIGPIVRLASISPVTSAAVRALGWTVAAEAEVYTWEGVARAIVSGTRGTSPAPARG
jgi:uroporphyrinogen III methyltransferase / synthase